MFWSSNKLIYIWREGEYVYIFGGTIPLNAHLGCVACGDWCSFLACILSDFWYGWQRSAFNFSVITQKAFTLLYWCITTSAYQKCLWNPMISQDHTLPYYWFCSFICWLRWFLVLFGWNFLFQCLRNSFAHFLSLSNCCLLSVHYTKNRLPSSWLTQLLWSRLLVLFRSRTEIFFQSCAVKGVPCKRQQELNIVTFWIYIEELLSGFVFKKSSPLALYAINITTFTFLLFPQTTLKDCHTMRRMLISLKETGLLYGWNVQGLWRLHCIITALFCTQRKDRN